MCLIVDVNVAHSVFCCSNDPVFGVVRDALYDTNPKRAVHMVSGGRLQNELCNNGVIAECLQELDRAGRLTQLAEQEVDREADRLQQSGQLRSNDSHIIALARLSNARVLCSNDIALREDFKDKALINNPGGKVFSSPKHVHLLKGCRLSC